MQVAMVMPRSTCGSSASICLEEKRSMHSVGGFSCTSYVSTASECEDDVPASGSSSRRPDNAAGAGCTGPIWTRSRAFPTLLARVDVRAGEYIHIIKRDAHVRDARDGGVSVGS